MRVYYTHCMAIYNTPQERRDWDVLRHLGPDIEIINTNTQAIADECKLVREDFNSYPSPYTTSSHAVMEQVFKPLVHSCDVVAFRGLPDGTIPAGIASEITWAQEMGIPVIELPSAIKRRTLTIEHTRDYLQEIGQR